MSESELDRLYRRVSAEDPARPSAAVREAVLEEAERLAARARTQPAHLQPAHLQPAHLQPVAPWRAQWLGLLRRWPQIRWQIAAPVAAAALAAVLLAPQWSAHRAAAHYETQAVAQKSLQLQPVPTPSANVARIAPRAPPMIPAPEAFPQMAKPVPAPAPASAAAPLAGAAPAPATPLPGAAAAPAENADLAETRARAPSAPSQDDLLQRTAARGEVSKVRTLLRASTAGINARDASGRTALMLAVMYRHASTVRELLGRGADPNIADAGGRTPLAVAEGQHQREVVEALLAAGAH